MKHILEAVVEMLDLPQFKRRDEEGISMNDHQHERAMKIAHLESALRLLRNHASSRDDCARTIRLIAETETQIDELRGGDFITPEFEPDSGWPETQPEPILSWPEPLPEAPQQTGRGMLVVVLVLLAALGAAVLTAGML